MSSMTRTLAALLGLCVALGGTTLLAFQVVGPPVTTTIEPWVDHLPGSPTAKPGTIQSQGEFDLTANYTFIQLRVLAHSTDPEPAFAEFSIPARQAQITGTTGTWNTSLPVAAGQHRVVGIVQIQNQTTGQIVNICTDFDAGLVTVP